MTDYWGKDLLDRKQDAEFLYDFLLGEIEKRAARGKTASYVMNVDAEWGGGKSFFLDGLAQDMEAKGHVVVRVNAWRDDHAPDPYVAIMAAIDKALTPLIESPGAVQVAWTKAKQSGGAIAMKVGVAVAKGLLKKATGVAVEEIEEIISGEDGAPELIKSAAVDAGEAAAEQLERLFDASLESLIKVFHATDAAMVNFRAKLEATIDEIAPGHRKPVFILIDELDRCRPSFAVNLLERVKHLFDVNGVVFVFATNADQLQHSIAGAYGPGFDGLRYLKRFFDRTYVFAEPSLEVLVETLCNDLPAGKIGAPEGKLAEAVLTGCKAFRLDIRSLIQVMDIVSGTLSAWPHRTPADISLLLPLAVHFHSSGKANWPTEADLPTLDAWRMKRIRRTSQGEADRSFKMAVIYKRCLALMVRMEKILNDPNRGSDDVSLSYAANIFVPEWDGVRRLDDQAPSIQMDLLPLVAQAGRLSTKSRV